jgi:hypothetical protein
MLRLCPECQKLWTNEIVARTKDATNGLQVYKYRDTEDSMIFGMLLGSTYPTRRAVSP